MPKKINYRFVAIFSLAFLVFNGLPLLLWASLVPCGINAGPNDCDWLDLVELFRRVLNFILEDILIPVSVLVIAWAGIQILLGKTKPGQLIKSKGTLVNVAIGIFLALGAYAIIKTILDLLVSNDSSVIRQAIEQVF